MVFVSGYQWDVCPFPTLTFCFLKRQRISKNTYSWLSQVNSLKGGLDFAEKGIIVKTNQPTMTLWGNYEAYLRIHLNPGRRSTFTTLIK